MKYFNSRTHVECDATVNFVDGQNIHFNSRTHVECDAWHRLRSEVKIVFQLTHSRGVRHDEGGIAAISCHFNSRTHVECDWKLCARAIFNMISTHALTWSATCRCFFTMSPAYNFNSRTHVECDGSRIPSGYV